MNDLQQTRLECLHIASRCCGDDVAYAFVLEAARKFYEFVLDSKLKVVVSNDEAG